MMKKSFFPIKIITSISQETLYIDKPEDLPVGESFRIQETNTKVPNFIILQNREGQKFFTSNNLAFGDPRKSENNEYWYTIIGYAETSEESWEKICGKFYN